MCVIMRPLERVYPQTQLKQEYWRILPTGRPSYLPNLGACNEEGEGCSEGEETRLVELLVRSWLSTVLDNDCVK